MGDKIKITVDPEIRDLIPGFLENKRKDLDLMRKLLEAGDYDQVRVLGHRTKGSGMLYGFETASIIGSEIEKLAKLCDKEKIAEQLDKLDEYFNNVEIV